MTLRFCLASFQQLLMQQIVRMLRIEDDVIGVVGIGMNPDGIFAPFEHTAKDSCQRTWS